MLKWKRLELRCKEQRPNNGEIVALYLMPNNSRATLYSAEKYDIGYFTKPDSGNKLWWHGKRGTEDPLRLKQHYDIWWTLIPEFDGV